MDYGQLVSFDMKGGSRLSTAGIWKNKIHFMGLKIFADFFFFSECLYIIQHILVASFLLKEQYSTVAI